MKYNGNWERKNISENALSGWPNTVNQKDKYDFNYKLEILSNIHDIDEHPEVMSDQFIFACHHRKYRKTKLENCFCT